MAQTNCVELVLHRNIHFRVVSRSSNTPLHGSRQLGARDTPTQQEESIGYAR